MSNKNSKKNEVRKRSIKLLKKKQISFLKVANDIRIIKLLLSLFEVYFKEEKKVALYYPLSIEINNFLIFKYCFETKKIFFLPKIINKKNKEMIFSRYLIKPALKGDVFLDFKQILVEKKKKESFLDINIFIVPLIAFNNNFARLGHGCGYYDLFFSRLKKRRFSSNIIVIGLAYFFQKASFPEECTDLVLDAVVTEEGYFFNNSFFSKIFCKNKLI